MVSEKNAFKVADTELSHTPWRSYFLTDKIRFLFVLLLYVPSQQLWSWQDGQFTLPHFFLGKLEQAVNQYLKKSFSHFL